jgi:D-sedoheptulose 7-phosphate isomerase
VSGDHTKDFMACFGRTVAGLDFAAIDSLANELAHLRLRHGRLFVAGIGGSAANATHAACDLRNLAGIDAVSLTDNVAAFSAAANDHGWDESLSHVLRRSHPQTTDGLLVMSVGGGSLEPPVSIPLVRVLAVATELGMQTFALVGPRGGIAADVASLTIRVSVEEPGFTTAHTEAAHAAVWHCLATHPSLAEVQPLWERLGR